jgi:hypothetical protein
VGGAAPRRRPRRTPADRLLRETSRPLLVVPNAVVPNAAAPDAAAPGG